MPRKKPPTVVTKAQAAFIESNPLLDDAGLAEGTGLTEAEVREFRKAAGFRQRSLMDASLARPAEGVVTMTAAASEHGDDVARRGAITQDMIERAKQANDFDGAKRLTELRDRQLRDREAEARAKNAGRWHWIGD